MLQSNEFFSMVGVPQIGWTGNENSKCGEFKGDKLGRLCMFSISTSSASVTTSLPASKSPSALPNVPRSTTNAGSDIQKWKPKLLKLGAAHTWSLSYLPTAVFASCSISLLSPPILLPDYQRLSKWPFSVFTKNFPSPQEHTFNARDAK